MCWRKGNQAYQKSAKARTSGFTPVKGWVCSLKKKFALREGLVGLKSNAVTSQGPECNDHITPPEAEAPMTCLPNQSKVDKATVLAGSPDYESRNFLGLGPDWGH